jgi:Spy/CpxP family protein refolding chaperone
MNWKRLLLLSSLCISAIALAQPVPPTPPTPPGPPPGRGPMGPGMGGPGMGPGMGPHGPGHRMPGIPPQVAKRLGIAPETVKKVQDASFDANEALIGLEADLKRAQLALEKTLAQPTVDEGQVMGKLDAVSKAELAVRKNRMGLMLKIRKLLGQDTWEKLQGEMPGPGPDDMMGGREMRREVRIVKHGDGTTETYDSLE